MNFKKKNLEFIDSRSEALLLSTSKSSRFLIWFTLLFFILIFTWMYYTEIDQLVRGEGRVAPAKKIQTVQSLEGGIISKILVHEGDVVSISETVIELDKKNFVSKEEENTLKIYELQAQIKRLSAEAHGKKFILKKGHLYTKLKQEYLLYKKNKELVAQDILILKKQLSQKRNELKEKKEKKIHLKNKLVLTQSEVSMKINLLAELVGSPAELNLAEQKLSDIQGEYAVTNKAIPRLVAAIEEVKLKIKKVKMEFQKKSIEELNKAKDELARVQKSNVSKKDRVERATLRSPVSGIVQRVLMNTIGGVVKPGEIIMEIIPTNDNLIINTKIRPSDIGFIYPNQKAIVRFSAYDFAIYGSLEAKVVNISADTIIDEVDKKHYYEVQIQTDKNYLGEENGKLQLMPGMVSTVDIVSRKKRVLDYMLKPILRARQNVLSQR